MDVHKYIEFVTFMNTTWFISSSLKRWI